MKDARVLLEARYSLYRSTILSRSFHESGVLAPLDRDPFSRSRLTLYEQRFFFFIFIKFHKQI